MSSRQGKVLTRLMEALNEQRFLAQVQDFVTAHSASFQYEPGREEHKLDWTALHIQYRQIFEAQASELLSREGLDLQVVEDLCASCTGGAAGGGILASYLEAVTASQDYCAFVAMMRCGVGPRADARKAHARLLGTMVAALDEPRFKASVMAFVVEHCKEFQVALEPGTGHRIEWSGLHRTYKEMHEAHLAEVLAREGFDGEVLVDLLRSVQAACASEGADSCLQLFSMSEDYETFASMMRRVEIIQVVEQTGGIVLQHVETESIACRNVAGFRVESTQEAAPQARTTLGLPGDHQSVSCMVAPLPACGGYVSTDSDRPPVGQASDTAGVYERRVRPPRKLPPIFGLLPANWSSYTTPDGLTYYANLLTNATQWERPLG